MRNAAVIALSVLVFAAATAGQSSTPPAGNMEPLVNEIRALRADLNRVAGASIRSQLLVGRLQLQEQRTVTLSRQLDTVQQELAEVTQEKLASEDRLKEVEESTWTEKPEERENLLSALRQQIKQQQRREQQLRQRESSLSALVADEQTRWTDFSSRLDDLERTLIAPRR
jgi:DNA repair exonuclease SbcCD ATPase subunit